MSADPDEKNTLIKMQVIPTFKGIFIFSPRLPSRLPGREGQLDGDQHRAGDFEGAVCQETGGTS